MIRLITFFSIALMSLSASGASPSLHEIIDREIEAKAGGTLAPQVTDAEFLRRASLDLTGCIPTADEARAFINDKAADKRSKLIDAYLTSDAFPIRLEETITVMLLERNSWGKFSEAAWRKHWREGFARNRPWNEMVSELFNIEGDPKASPVARFITDGEKMDAEKVAQDVARLFLGMNLKCAQCHNHPTVDSFEQGHFYGIYAYLAPASIKEDKALKAKVLADEVVTAPVNFKSVFNSNEKKTAPRMPGMPETTIPVLAAGAEYVEPPVKNGKIGVPVFRPRLQLAHDLTDPANVGFTRNSVNRFWFLLMGRGLVHPLDMMHDENPPSHPALLDELTKEFAAHKFDVRWLLREIALSKAYARSSAAPQGEEVRGIPPASYRVANLKPLSGEQVGRSIARAVGHLDTLAKAAEELDKDFVIVDFFRGKAKHAPLTLKNVVDVFAKTFGNPAGEPEVEFAPSVSHSLFLMNERMVLDWLKPVPGNLASRLIAKTTAQDVAEELYLSVLTRMPTKDEAAEVATYLEKNPAKREAMLKELTWALLASAEFRLNH